LMEGSYDLVWKAMASREVPSEEYGVFSEVGVSLTPTIQGDEFRLTDWLNRS
jgi:hypothetical protein